MKAKRFIWLILVLLLFVAPSAFATPVLPHPVLLSELLRPQATYQVGDKIFYGFTGYSSFPTGVNASGVDPANIIVIPLIETIGGVQEWGLRFKSVFFYAGPNSSQDTTWTYAVTTVGGGDIIVDNVLRVGGVGSFGYGSVLVGETAVDENFEIVADKLVVEFPSGGGIIMVQKFFEPQDILIISKDIGLMALGDSSVFISEVDQLYSQKIPEPISLILLGSGLIGLAGYGRKKFFKK